MRLRRDSVLFICVSLFFFFSSRRRHTRCSRDWSSDVCSSDLVSASTQNQSLSAVLFLYDVVLGRRLEWMAHIVRAQRPARLPVVLSRAEVATPAAETVCVSRTDALDDVLRQYGMTEDGDWP